MKIAGWLAAVAGSFLWCVSIGAGEPRSTRAAAVSTAPDSPQPQASSTKSRVRTRRGLLVLYDFGSSKGSLVKDRSGVGKPLDLRIGNVKAVRRFKGSLQVRAKTLIRSDKAAAKITDAIRRTGEITIEAWIQPARTAQTGPARMFTLSKNAGERNFTLGQDEDRFEMRLRTTGTSKNGVPALSSPRNSLSTKLIHVVYTRDRSGRARIFLNGKRTAMRTIAGKTANWNRSYRLALANELSHDRPWLGTYFLVAVYQRALSPQEIERNFKAGAGAGAKQILLTQKKLALNARLFKKQIAPLLARRCLECHGWKSKQGRLDLSRKFAALRGGESGKVIVPGKAADSLLWKSVKSDEMPKNRTPLSLREKNLLRFWIDNGANWSIETIDASQFAASRRSGSNW
ncbi:MAG: hypothetical protein IID45_02415, partial [Planctomycetes bacterium]|nr:hypothetical protein [Planctomycetota bacterium]